MSDSLIPADKTLDTEFIMLAREIAMEMYPIEEILARYKISMEAWKNIQANRTFQRYLDQQVIEWNSVASTAERVKYKAAALTEYWLEEANTQLHDREVALAPKVELAKFVGRLAGFGIPGPNGEGGSEGKFSVTINLGNDKVTYEKDIPQKVIQHEQSS